MPKGAERIKVNVKERVEDEHCDLSLSELSEIPTREIASFKRVTSLDLSSNRLVTLGRNFGTLRRLVKLDLSKNQIRVLPEDFGQLECLRHLNLYDNRLEHLPLSFGRLQRLRYLDLKSNPLAPAWEKVVGRCSTLKDCQQAAKNTVSICANFQPESMARERERLAQERQMNGADEAAAKLSAANNTAKKTGKQHKKAKAKKTANGNDNELTIKPVHANAKAAASQKSNPKRKTGNGSSWLAAFTGPALHTLLLFLLLFMVNVFIIYMIMFKNPDIAEKLVEYIPQQYRDWILTKTEFFRLRVSDWISEFRTPPEEH